MQILINNHFRPLRRVSERERESKRDSLSFYIYKFLKHQFVVLFVFLKGRVSTTITSDVNHVQT